MFTFQFIASSSQTLKRQGEKIASTFAVKIPSRQKFQMAKTFWMNTAYYGKIQRCSIHTQTVTQMFKSLSASSADSLWAEDRNAPIRKRHFNCLFPERSAYAELLLCDWPINFIILRSFLSETLLTETFLKFVDNFTTSVFQMHTSIKSLPSCYFKVKFHFSTSSPQTFPVGNSFEHSCKQYIEFQLRFAKFLGKFFCCGREEN